MARKKKETQEPVQSELFPVPKALAGNPEAVEAAVELAAEMAKPEELKPEPVVGLTLYQIDRQLAELSLLLEELEADGAGEERRLAPVLAEMDRYFNARKDKVDACARFIHFCDSQARAVQNTIDRLQRHLNTWQTRGDRVREVVRHSMIVHNVDRLETAENTFNIRPAGGKQAVEVVDLGAVPNEYCMVTLTVPLNVWHRMVEDWRLIEGNSELTGYVKGDAVPSKTAIGDALARGVSVPGARLMERKKLLEVK